MLFISSLNGCGYTLNTIKDDSLETIHVEIFKNNIDITKESTRKDRYEIYRPNIEIDLRDAIIERIFLDGSLKVSSSRDSDSVLEGEILELRKDPLRYQDEEVREYRLTIICDFRLKRGEEVLLEKRGSSGDSTYFTTGSLSTSEESALKEAYGDIARTIINDIVERW